jgi:hypothetical protein
MGVLLLAGVLAAPLRAQEVTEPFGADDARAESGRLHIPEPMVFDLVRPLGARKGEGEVNTLFIVPLEKRSGDWAGALGQGDDGKVLWAPEIEAAVRDGLGLEFELPFESTSLDAIKFAAQLTLGIPVEDVYIHGLQGIAERFLDPKLWELTLVYVPGIRFSKVWSVLAMVGVRTTVGSDAHDHTEALLNATLFADVGARTSLGFEANVATDFDASNYFLVLPQLHNEIGERWMIQAGFGAESVDGGGYPLLAFRFIYTF